MDTPKKGNGRGHSPEEGSSWGVMGRMGAILNTGDGLKAWYWHLSDPTGACTAARSTYIFEGDDVGVLAVPQQNLNLFRGVSLALVNDLEHTEQFCGVVS